MTPRGGPLDENYFKGCAAVIAMMLVFLGSCGVIYQVFFR